MENQSRNDLTSFSNNPIISRQDIITQIMDDDSDINMDEEDECDGYSQENEGLYLSKETFPNVDSVIDNQQMLQTKARNREHAKNTRIRRKNYIETLKDQIMNLSKVRDFRETERKTALSSFAHKTSQRKAVLEKWFQYRTSMESDLAKWREILEEDFECTMPLTPYRSFPPDQVQNGRRKVAGIADMVFDCLSLHVMLRSSVTPRNQTHLPKVTLRYEVSQESIMATDTFMCKWRLCTEDLVARGAMFEVAKQGMLLAVFSPQNKLRSLEISFDVMSFMQQLRRTTARNTFMMVPNTIYKRHKVDKLELLCSVSCLSLPTSNPNNKNNTSTATIANMKANEAYASFMGASDPRAVLSATEPHDFLLINKKFSEIFHSHHSDARNTSTTSSSSADISTAATSISANIDIQLTPPEEAATTAAAAMIVHSATSSSSGYSLFHDLIRMHDNRLKLMVEMEEYIKSKQPCTAVLNCSTDGDPPAILPCLCCFYPLFGDGAVQQYLLTLEVIPAATTMRLTSEALDQRATATATSQQQKLLISPSISGSTNSGNTQQGELVSRGSGMTDPASGSSDTPTEMDVVVPPTTSLRRHHTVRHKPGSKGEHRSEKSSLSLSSNGASLTSHSTTTDLQSSEFGGNSLCDGESTLGSEDRWIRDFAKTHSNQDQISCGSHSLNPSVSGRSSHKLNRQNLQEPVSVANKSTRMGRENNSITEMSSTSALSDSGSGGNNSRMEQGSSGNDSGSDNGRGGGSGGQSPPGGSDSLSSDQMQMVSTERSSPSVSSGGSGNGSPGHCMEEGSDHGPRRNSSGSEDSGSGSQNSADGMKKKKDRDGHAVKKRHTLISFE